VRGSTWRRYTGRVTRIRAPSTRSFFHGLGAPPSSPPEPRRWHAPLSSAAQNVNTAGCFRTPFSIQTSRPSGSPSPCRECRGAWDRRDREEVNANDDLLADLRAAARLREGDRPSSGTARVERKRRGVEQIRHSLRLRGSRCSAPARPARILDGTRFLDRAIRSRS